MKTLRERVVYIRGMEEITNLDYEEPLAKMFFQVLAVMILCLVWAESVTLYKQETFYWSSLL